MATVNEVIDTTIEDPERRTPLVIGEHDYGSITRLVCRINEGPTPLAWYIGFAISLSLMTMFFALIGYLIFTGVGVWGNNQPVYWGFPIVNFVFWVGIGHAGTLISAILFIFRQNWRTSINRFAEAMTIFAVACAGVFPAVHIGRVWVFYWLFPIPSLQLSMWPNFRSPLLWDVFAVSTYATVSIIFWYTGMIPDLATLRDRATNPYTRFAYSILSLGWTGSARSWSRYEKAYTLFAALAAPLVLSVHTIVSFDFAVSQLPGWHTTIFPPYFVAGAVFSGFGMVLTLIIPARKWFGLQDVVTLRHLENVCKILLVTGMMVGYAYAMEFFIAWYSGNPYEGFLFLHARPFGWYAEAYRTMIFCNVLIPQLFWFPACRRNVLLLWICSLIVNVGMWLERYVIVITSLSQDFLPSSWAMYYPTFWDWATFLGTIGLFLFLMFLFIRFLPVIAIAEMRELVHEKDHHAARERGLPAAEPHGEA